MEEKEEGMFPAHARRFGWDPLAEMWRFQNEMNQLFSDPIGRAASATFPPINLWVGVNNVVVTAEIPGIASDELELTVREDTLALAGERKRPASADGASWHRYERAYGRFSRTIQLLFRVDVDKIEARFYDGVLEIELQRPEADKPRRVTITVK